MASFLNPSFSILLLLLVALLASFASSARILDEADPAALAPIPPTTPTITPPGAAIPNPAQGTAAAAATSAIPAGNADPAALAPVPPTTPITPPGPIPNPATSAIPASSLTFFMHDILGGSRPSAIAVTGIVANPSVGGQVPFARPNGAVLPAGNNNPNSNNNNNNNNNVPFLTGLSGFPTNLMQTNNNNVNGNGNGFIGGGGAGFPVLNSAQFPSGTTLQKLMFGTMTVFDDELTEGKELQGSGGLVGKAQGFYIASSEDGSSLTMAFTVMFASGRYEDSLSFFGVHRTAVAESQLAVMGGTGKYVGAKGFATAKTFPAANQGETDGVETLLEITVELAY